MWIVVACVGLVARDTWADKPKATDARAAFEAWQKTVSQKQDAAIAGMGVPFRVAAYKDANELACDLTISDRAKLVDAYKCIVDANVNFIDLKPYSKKLLGDLGQLSSFKAEIEKLDKTTVMYGKYERGEGMSVFTIVAIGADPADHKPRVVAVYAWTVLT